MVQDNAVQQVVVGVPVPMQLYMKFAVITKWDAFHECVDAQPEHHRNDKPDGVFMRRMDVPVLHPDGHLLQQQLDEKPSDDPQANGVAARTKHPGHQVQEGDAEDIGPAERQDDLQQSLFFFLKQESQTAAQQHGRKKQDVVPQGHRSVFWAKVFYIWELRGVVLLVAWFEVRHT